MFSHNTGLFTLTLILQTVMILSLIKNDCPKACLCDPKLKTVECFSEFWRQLPDSVPEGTVKLVVNGHRFKKLGRPPSCRGYSQLTNLDISKCGITQIAVGAFRCMPKLQSLDLRYNGLGKSVFPALCAIQSLTKIQLNYNIPHYITRGNLECLGFLKHLSQISLNGNKISGPVNVVVKPLKNVSSFIDLTSCWITLVNYAFAGFKVAVLDLSYNFIFHVPKHAFGKMLNLTTLILANNMISETQEWLGELSLQRIIILNNAFYEIPFITKNIKQVILSNNKYLVNLSISIANLENLEELDISGCKINYIAFHNLPRLEKLAINYNSISADNLESIFLDLVNSSLRTLHLQQSLKINILNQTFRHFKPNNLKELDLSGSRIGTIVPGTFENFKALQKLNLQGIGISTLSKNIFENLTNLTTLDLSDNHLTYFHGGDLGLQHCPLSELAINNNEFSEVHLSNFLTLTKLVLNHNGRFTYIFYLTKYISLQYLDLSHNDMHIYGNYRVLSNITYVDLSINPLRINYVLQSNWNMHDLQTLRLSGIPFGQKKLWNELHNFENFENLENLEISSCEIEALVQGMFSNLINLRKLHASSNRIPFFEPLAFQNASKLTELYLDNNDITHITWESLVYLPDLKLLSLVHNPLFCTCEVLWIFQAVTTLNLVYIPDRHGAHLVCKHPQEVQNVRVTRLKLKVSDCEGSWLDILKPVSGGFGGIIAIYILYILWYYRWRIRYTIFLAKAGLGRYEELQDDHEYVNDAFVAYCATDLPWVKEQLLPNIDINSIGPRGYKLCLHHRDWLGGVDIVENIVKSIAESRRTIIVLTRDFATSHWCQFELAMAHMRLYAEGSKKCRLLVILLEDIPADLLTPRLVHILTSKSYINWPKEADSQRFFWETLRKSLAKGPLYT